MVIAMVVAIMLVPAAMATAVMVMMLLPAITHPAILHEIHRLAAGAVAAAVAAPILLMRRWHVQIDRRTLHRDARRRNDHRLGQHQRGPRHIADVDAPVDARLVDADRDADAGLRRR